MFMDSIDLIILLTNTALNVLPKDTAIILYCDGIFSVVSLAIKSEIPVSCIQEYEEEHSKLVSVVTSMEQNIKTLLKDFDSKKKVSIEQLLCYRTHSTNFIIFFPDFTGEPSDGDREKALCLFLHKS